MACTCQHEQDEKVTGMGYLCAQSRLVKVQGLCWRTVTSKGRLPRNTDLPESYSTFLPPPLMLLLTPAARSTLI